MSSYPSVSDDNAAKSSPLAGSGYSLHKSARIFTGAKIGQGCVIEKEVIVERGARIGLNCHLGPSAYISGRVVIGSLCTIGAFSLIKPLGKIGDEVSLENVTLGPEVHIGANCHIANSTMIAGRTFLGRDVSIGEKSLVSNRVSIGDGSTVGHSVRIYHRARLGRAVKIGDGAVLGPYCRIDDGMTIPAGVVVVPRQRVSGEFRWAAMPSSAFSSEARYENIRAAWAQGAPELLLKPKMVFREKNLTTRATLIRRLGWSRILAELPSQVLDEQGEGVSHRKLLKFKVPGFRTDVHAVKVTCWTTGVFYMLLVPSEMKTCQEAVAWTFGLKAEEYHPEIEA